MMSWLKKHPQMTASLLLGVFAQIQGSLALYDFKLSPLLTWGVNTTFAVVMFLLAFAVKNLKDDASPPETPQ